MLPLSAALLAFVLWATRRAPVLRHQGWRLLAAALAVAAVAAAVFVGLRGAWGKSIVLVVLGLGLAGVARRPAAAPVAPPPEEMSLAQARSLLGVGPGADAAEIAAAYSRLMRIAHPDKGGTAGLAAQLNAARARLLRG